MRNQKVYADFEFRDWEKAFAKWDELYQLYPKKIIFVISTSEYSSGYWIQSRGSVQFKNETWYRTDTEVQALKKRVIAEIERAKIEGGSPKFTT